MKFRVIEQFHLFDVPNWTFGSINKNENASKIFSASKIPTHMPFVWYQIPNSLEVPQFFLCEGIQQKNQSPIELEDQKQTLNHRQAGRQMKGGDTTNSISLCIRRHPHSTLWFCTMSFGSICSPATDWRGAGSMDGYNGRMTSVGLSIQNLCRCLDRGCVQLKQCSN